MVIKNDDSYLVGKTRRMVVELMLASGKHDCLVCAGACGVRARVAVEAGTAVGWEHYVGLDGDIVGMTTFGTSAPGKEAYAKFGFTADNVAARAKALLKK